MLFKSSQLSYLFKKKKFSFFFNRSVSDIGTIAPGQVFDCQLKKRPLLQFNCNKVTQNNCHNCSNLQIKKVRANLATTPVKVTTKCFVQLWPSFTAEWNEKSQITSCPERTLQLPSSRCFLWVDCHFFFTRCSHFLLALPKTTFGSVLRPQTTAGPPGVGFRSVSTLAVMRRSEIITLFWVWRKTKLPKVTHGHHLAHFHSFFFCAVRPIILNTWRFRLGRGLLGSEKVSGHQPTKNLRWVMSVCFSLKLSS